MSDGREGCVEYIPLNDMDHPIVSVGEEVRQVDEDWYCVHMVEDSKGFSQRVK